MFRSKTFLKTRRKAGYRFVNMVSFLQRLWNSVVSDILSHISSLSNQVSPVSHLTALRCSVSNPIQHWLATTIVRHCAVRLHAISVDHLLPVAQEQPAEGGLDSCNCNLIEMAEPPYQASVPFRLCCPFSRCSFQTNAALTHSKWLRNIIFGQLYPLGRLFDLRSSTTQGQWRLVIRLKIIGARRP